MCRKKYEPHKCEYVPVNEALDFIMQIPTLFESAYKLQLNYRDALKSGSRWQWRNAGRSYKHSSEAKAITAMLQLRYRYTDSYLSTGDALHRFVCIYGEYREQIQARRKGNNT